MKTVEGSDRSQYLIPVPGIAPPGLRLSIHPSGTMHVKSRDHGVVARGKTGQFIASVEDGTLDRLVSTMLVRPPRFRAAGCLVVPHEWIAELARSSGSYEFRIDGFVESVRPVLLGDSRHVASDLRLLRHYGFLRQFDTLFVPDPRPDGTLVFFNVQGVKPVTIPPFEISHDLPFWRSFTLALSHVRRYGGVFVLIPEGKRLQRIADRLGFGDILRGFDFVDEPLKELGVNTELGAQVKAIEEGFIPAVAGLKPLSFVRVAALRRQSLQDRLTRRRPYEATAARTAASLGRAP
ncbi:MAG TPA: hypothetical protein VFF67_06140 [Thermoplasmata archaeon]|nr:hypothetical protein [Thermoplasmata archaeon]